MTIFTDNLIANRLEDDPFLDYDVMFGLSISISIVSFFGFWFAGWKSVSRYGSYRRADIRTAAWGCMFLSLGLLCASSMLGTFYSRIGEDYTRFSYKGNMVVNDVKYEIKERKANCHYKKEPCEQGHDCCLITEAQPMTTMAWGYEWACPATPKKECLSEINFESCNIEACVSLFDVADKVTGIPDYCPEDQKEDAMTKAQECVKKHLYEGNYPPYNPRDPPSLHPEQPKLEFFGDCNTCEITTHAPKAKRMWILKEKSFRSVCCSAGWFVLSLIGMLYDKFKGKNQRSEFQNRRRWKGSNEDDDTLSASDDEDDYGVEDPYDDII